MDNKNSSNGLKKVQMDIKIVQMDKKFVKIWQKKWFKWTQKKFKWTLNSSNWPEKSLYRHENSSNGQKKLRLNVRVDNNKGLYKFPVNIKFSWH